MGQLRSDNEYTDRCRLDGFAIVHNSTAQGSKQQKDNIGAIFHGPREVEYPPIDLF